MNTARRTAFPRDGLLHSMCSTCSSAVVLAARLSKVPCGQLLLGRPCHAREGHGGVHACVWQGAALPYSTAHACMHHLLGHTGPTCVHCGVWHASLDRQTCSTGLTLEAVCQENMRNSLRTSINTGRRMAAERRLWAVKLRQCLHKRLAKRRLQQH